MKKRYTYVVSFDIQKLKKPEDSDRSLVGVCTSWKKARAMAQEVINHAFSKRNDLTMIERGNSCFDDKDTTLIIWTDYVKEYAILIERIVLNERILGLK